MTPTLFGRLQTRVFLLAFVGSLWTLIISPVLPGMGSLPSTYGATFSVLALVLVLGLVWEVIYHGLQQFRWEKDWPALFGLLTGINEGLVAFEILRHVTLPGNPAVPTSAFLIDFTTVWVVTWLFVNGPMRVPFMRWRFRGGRIF